MDESRPPRVWLIMAVGALLAMAAVVWLPTTLSPPTAQSPLPTPGDPGMSLPPMAKAGITLLFVALGVGMGVVVILVDRLWHARRPE